MNEALFWPACSFHMIFVFSDFYSQANPKPELGTAVICSHAVLQAGKESYKGDVLSVLLNIFGQPGILVLAVTNFPDRLDDAIVRAGRIEEHIPVLPMSYYERQGWAGS